jgi:uncharacterized protein (UPF0332 family)
MGVDESADIDVAAALQEAYTLLSDVRAFKDSGVSDDTTVNRLYYACYHATKAACTIEGTIPERMRG